jgi:thymidylate synthase (FAD)
MSKASSLWEYPVRGPLSVILINHTPDPEKSIAVAGRVCYTDRKATELLKEMSEAEQNRILRILLTSGHHAALEHASYTFALSGVSRAMTHQLVRHRLASYNQQSQRYVQYDKHIQTVKPASICASPDASAVFDELMNRIHHTYQQLCDLGIPSEDARYVLSNATASEIVVTMNVRELLHFISLRCCRRAQWEIREVSSRMLELARPTAPSIFMDAGPSCVRGICAEGKLTCGNPFQKAAARF